LEAELLEASVLSDDSPRVCFGKGRPRLDGALNSVNGAAELRQHAVPSGIRYPATIGGD
jgi:hypothetical protein